MTRPLLQVDQVSISYTRSGPRVAALDQVSLAINRGETLGLVGESGSGKSTLGRAIVGLVPLDGGRIAFDGTDLSHLPRKLRLPMRSRLQMVFQDPFASLNPRSTIGRILDEPLVVHRRGDRRERLRRVVEMMECVGLRPDMAGRYPNELSGGQRQRVGIARALILNPDLVVLDEAVSALDISIRAQIINLLLDLRQRLRVTYLFISHDLSVVRHMSDRIAVMYRGRIVELADSSSICGAPVHPYTRSLIASSRGAGHIASPTVERDEIV